MEKADRSQVTRGTMIDILCTASGRLLCRFSDAGMSNLSTRSCGRRPKSARHEIAVGGALAVPRALWGIERGVGLKEDDAKRSSPWLRPKA